MKKAYKKYLTKSVSGKKYYKVVNIGDRNKPVLLIGTYKGFGKGTYTGCNVYYYKSGKVRKVGSLSDGRDIALYTKKGQNYINNGLSDEALYLCVKDGKSYLCAYYNSHNWKIDPDKKVHTHGSGKKQNRMPKMAKQLYFKGTYNLHFVYD